MTTVLGRRVVTARAASAALAEVLAIGIAMARALKEAARIVTARMIAVAAVAVNAVMVPIAVNAVSDHAAPAKIRPSRSGARKMTILAIASQARVNGAILTAVATPAVTVKVGAVFLVIVLGVTVLVVTALVVIVLVVTDRAVIGPVATARVMTGHAMSALGLSVRAVTTVIGRVAILIVRESLIVREDLTARAILIDPEILIIRTNKTGHKQNLPTATHHVAIASSVMNLSPISTKAAARSNQKTPSGATKPASTASTLARPFSPFVRKI